MEMQPSIQQAQTFVSVKDFGATGDGVADDTTAIKSAIAAAQITDAAVYIPGGRYKITSEITIANPNAEWRFGKHVSLFGDGAATSVILPSGNFVALNFNFQYTGPSGQSRQVLLRQIGLLQTSATKIGTGVRINGLAYGAIQDVQIEGFATGLRAVDTIASTFERVFFNQNSRGISLDYASYSRPNAISILECNVYNSTEFGLSATNPCELTIQGGAWEQNGTMGGALSGAIYINGGAVDGSKGLIVRNVYFQSNRGAADIYIDHNGGGDTHHTIENNDFARVNPDLYVVHHIYITKPAQNMLGVNIIGNSFKSFGGYTPSNSRRVIQTGTMVDVNYNIVNQFNLFPDSDLPDLGGSLAGRWALPFGWARFNGTTGALAIGSNVSSITRSAVGTYRINFKKPLLAGAVAIGGSTNASGMVILDSEAADSIVVRTVNTATLANQDYTAVSVLIFGPDSGTHP